MTTQFVQRMPSDLNDRLVRLAEMQGISKNELINAACQKFLATGNFADLESRVSELEKRVFGKTEKKKMTSVTKILHYGEHTMRLDIRPSSELGYDAFDAIRALCKINGTPDNLMNDMPENASDEVYEWFYLVIRGFARRNPKAKAFLKWFDEQIDNLLEE